MGRTDHHLRSVVIFAAFLAFALAAVTRLSYWQVARATDLRLRAADQLERTADEPSIRGDILDRNGRVLATTGFRDTLAAYPDQIGAAAVPGIVAALADILDLDDDGRQAFSEKLSKADPYVVLEREIDPSQSRQVRDGLAGESLRGLVLEPHAVRVYPIPGGAPDTTLGSQLLGFVSADGTGHYGIEQTYNAILAGSPKVVAAARDPYGRTLESSARVIQPGVDGQDIRLTIDASLQLQLEKELYAAWVADKAKGVSGLIMDPDNGEILAWASVPGYDANQYARVAANRPGLLQDPIVSQLYEPGSVMKMLTATAALESHTETLGSRVRDGFALRFGTQLVRDADWGSMGWLPFRDAIAYSRNVAVARVAARLGRGTRSSAGVLYRTWQQLGIGKPSGVDVADEVAGIAADPHVHPWAPIDLANRAFGQSVAVTPIQLATAYTPMLNGGLHVQPHFLQAVAGEVRDAPKATRIIPAATAGQLRTLLKHVVSAVPWYADGTLIKGYRVGGKTGTAQIWRSKEGRYDPNTFNFSFIGYIGARRPQAVVALRISEATPKILGRGIFKMGITSYQLFRHVAVDIIPVLDISRSSQPSVGMPEPFSQAEKVLEPKLYAQRLWAREHGHRPGSGGSSPDSRKSHPGRTPANDHHQRTAR